MAESLQAAVYEQLEREPARRVLGFMDSLGTVSWRTWGELYEGAAKLALRLAEEGLGRGDVCVIVLPSEEFCATAVTATILRGGVPLLVAPPILQGPNSNLAKVLVRTLQKTGAPLAICDESLLAMREEIQAGATGTRLLFGEPDAAGRDTGSLARVRPGGEEIAAIQLTSGTTGFPRVCVWKQRNVMAALRGMREAMKLRADDVCFNWTPLYHDMGLVNNFFLSLSAGVPLVMLSPHEFVKRPALWLRGLSETGSTMTWSPNFGYAITAKRVRDSELDGVRLDRVRAFWNAAERIHLETILAFHERFSSYGVELAALKTNFGCAENVGGATFSDPDGLFVYEHVDRDTLQAKRIAVRVDPSTDGQQAVPMVSAGRAVPTSEVVILSEAGKSLPDGRVGEVALRTPSRMVGYLDDPEATRRALDGDLLRTGDLGYRRNGELFWVGRVQERINVWGKKLDPSDFEPVLHNIAGLRHGCFAAFGVDDQERGSQRVVVVSEVRDESPESLRRVRREIRGRVTAELGIEVNEVLLVPRGTLTKTSSGKRRHRHFRERYVDGELRDLALDPSGRAAQAAK